MLPLLLDDVARAQHADILRVLESDHQAAQLPRSSRPWPRLRMRAGQIFIVAGTYLLERRTTRTPVPAGAPDR